MKQYCDIYENLKVAIFLKSFYCIYVAYSRTWDYLLDQWKALKKERNILNLWMLFKYLMKSN